MAELAGNEGSMSFFRLDTTGKDGKALLNELHKLAFLLSHCLSDVQTCLESSLRKSLWCCLQSCLAKSPLILFS